MRPRALLLATWGAAVALTVAAAWAGLCAAPGLAWNPARLAPAYAIAQGLDPYATRASGAHLGWFYGPVFPLFSLPAAFVPNLTLSFLAWGALNLAAIFVPAWVVLRTGLDRRGAALGLGFYGALLLVHPATHAMFFWIHIDALCVGLGFIAAAAIWRWTQGRGTAALHAAALAAALAVWTKQLALVVPVVLVAWTARHAGARPAARLAAWLVIYGGGLGLGFMRWFGSEELLFNLWLIHARNPLKASWLPEGTTAAQLLPATVLWLAVVLGAGRRGPGAKTAGSAESLLLWLALGSLPLGVMAALKEGGGVNSVHSVHALGLLAAFGLARAAAPDAAPRGAGLAAGAVAAVVALAAWQLADYPLRATPDRGQEAILRQAEENRGRLYLPWNPLVTLITDRKIYPFDNALYCLWLSRLEPSREAVRAAVPAGAFILYHEPVQSRFALRYFRSEPVAAP